MDAVACRTLFFRNRNLPLACASGSFRRRVVDALESAGKGCSLGCRSVSIRRAPSAPAAAPAAESLHASTAFARVTGWNNQLQHLPRACRSVSLRKAPSAPAAAPAAEFLHASTDFACVTDWNNQLQRRPLAGPPAAAHRHRVRLLIG